MDKIQVGGEKAQISGKNGQANGGRAGGWCTKPPPVVLAVIELALASTESVPSVGESRGWTWPTGQSAWNKARAQTQRHRQKVIRV